jgi:hypothetical protein
MRIIAKKTLVPIFFLAVVVYIGYDHFEHHAGGHNFQETLETLQLVLCGLLAGIYIGYVSIEK